MWEASKLCSYSQEYLSLLSRRGLLKATKQGKKWYTTIPWLNDYLADKKPGEVIHPKRASIFSLGKTGVGKQWAVALVILVVLFSVVHAFDGMSTRIAELEERIALTAIKP